MRHVALAIASVGMAVALQAQPRAASLGAVKHARGTLTAVSVGPSSAQLLLTLAVDAGWHVSWSNPGETGLPTRFAWSLPAGVRVRRETWPVPTVVRSDVGVAHTLEGEVPWLIDLAIETPVGADRLVSVTVRYGVCRDVCIPEQLTVQGIVPGSGSASMEPVPAALRQRLAVDVAAVPARRSAVAGLCLDRLPSALAGQPVLMIAGPDRALDGALPAAVASRGGAVRVRVPAAARLREPVDTVLLVAGTRGVTVPLDFRAPAPRCR